ncbi:hypothetical protein [Burkholderia anthina]|uniref:hypothetical protein n=1 Tax=Burkholderia anthina TaxID=179879 RepID=UPI00158952F9|nr:hypothetical protein [Burkholderia anthina]
MCSRRHRQSVRVCRLGIVEDELPDLNLVALRQVTIANRRVRDHTTTATGLNGSLADVWLTA